MSISDLQKQWQRALDYLGLWPWPLQNSTQASAKSLIKKRYFALAIQHHPDQKGNEQEFIKLGEEYNYLKDALQVNSETFLAYLNKNHKTENISSATNNEVKIYDVYKKAAELFNSAFEKYFEKPRSVNLNPDDETYLQLASTLKQVKELLTAVIQTDPSGIWVSDSIDKISRINIWLKAENSKKPVNK